MANFDVTPEELEASANRIEAKVAEFTKAYNNIYTAVSDLNITYKGESASVFNQRIEGYRNDFSAAEGALTRYVEFLREYAGRIRNVEDDLKNKAGSLSVGR